MGRIVTPGNFLWHGAISLIDQRRRKERKNMSIVIVHGLLSMFTFLSSQMGVHALPRACILMSMICRTSHAVDAGRRSPANVTRKEASLPHGLRARVVLRKISLGFYVVSANRAPAHSVGSTVEVSPSFLVVILQ
jgi:hypothetical protein